MPGKSSRRKGYSGEIEFAKLVGGVRVPLSGAAGGEFAGDVIWPGLGRGEIKRRKDGFKRLYAWLEGRDWLAVRGDRREWLVILTLDKLLEVIRCSESPQAN